jgi:hypothetical protein
MICQQCDAPLIDPPSYPLQTNGFGKQLPLCEPQVGDSSPVGEIVRPVARFVPYIVEMEYTWQQC